MIEIVRNTKNRNLKNANIVRIDILCIYAFGAVQSRAKPVHCPGNLDPVSPNTLLQLLRPSVLIQLLQSQGQPRDGLLHSWRHYHLTTVTCTTVQPSRNSNLVFSIKTFHFHPQHLFLLLLQFMTLLLEPLIRGTWFRFLQISNRYRYI